MGEEREEPISFRPSPSLFSFFFPSKGGRPSPPPLPPPPSSASTASVLLPVFLSLFLSVMGVDSLSSTD